MIATIFDTGPVVAFLDGSDTHHDECVELMKNLSGRRLLPVTVLVEVCWLLEDHPEIEASFLEAVASGAFELLSLGNADVLRISELVRQYADMPLGAVDASVVTLAERLEIQQVATLDRRHFSVIRPCHIDALTLLP